MIYVINFKLSLLFYELLNIKMTPGLYKHPVYISGVAWYANWAIATPQVFSYYYLSWYFIAEKYCLTGKNLIL